MTGPLAGGGTGAVVGGALAAVAGAAVAAEAAITPRRVSSRRLLVPPGSGAGADESIGVSWGNGWTGVQARVAHGELDRQEAAGHPGHGRDAEGVAVDGAGGPHGERARLGGDAPVT
jgi:hypothetical protein